MATSTSASATPMLGKVLIAGGTDWATLGRKAKGKKAEAETVNAARPNLEGPHVFATAPAQVSAIFAGHSSVATILLDQNRKPYLFGRNEHGQLGTDSTDTVWEPTSLSNKTVFPSVPSKLRNAEVAHAVLSRSHTIIVTADGEAYASGSNSLGQLGDKDTGRDILSFQRIEGPLLDEKVIQASAGITFSLVLTESGKVYAFGSAEKGQLGNGRSGEHVANSKIQFSTVTTPTVVKGLDDHKIVAIASGQQHSLALTEDGNVFSWGFGGVGRLAHGVQQDCLVPKRLSCASRILRALTLAVFNHDRDVLRASAIACGPTASSFLDRKATYHLAGKFKTTGDGSTGQPWMNPKVEPQMQSLQVTRMSHGSSGLFALTEIGPVAFGQGCTYGELAGGEGAVKSATKPQEISTLDKLQVLDIVAGQNTTFFLVAPPGEGSSTDEAVFNALPRFPADGAEPPAVTEAPPEDDEEGADSGKKRKAPANGSKSKKAKK